MPLRAIPPAFDPATVAAIDAKLDAIERDHRVRILLAVESGSRAWGFPSPDSDYDCRFLHVRRRDDYFLLGGTRRQSAGAEGGDAELGQESPPKPVALFVAEEFEKADIVLGEKVDRLAVTARVEAGSFSSSQPTGNNAAIPI